MVEVLLAAEERVLKVEGEPCLTTGSGMGLCKLTTCETHQIPNEAPKSTNSEVAYEGPYQSLESIGL